MHLINFWLYHRAGRTLVPQPGSNPCPLYWQHRILTAGPPGKSSVLCFKLSTNLRSVMKSLAIQLHPNRDMNRPFVRIILPVSHSVAISYQIDGCGIWVFVFK